MFVCRGCLRSLTGTGPSVLGPRLLTSWRTTTAPVSSRRTVYVGKGIKVDLRSTLADRVEHGDPRYASKTRKSVTEELRVDDGEDLAYEGVSPKGGELGKERYEKKLQAAVKKRLELYPDPYHIAQQVSRALEKGSFDEALLMARMASRNAKVEVSWNHLIDYQLKNKRLHAAIKLYNEMKKRAQIPNAKTYTISFRGCAHSLHPKLAVAEATRIYNFMIKSGSLKPNTIHMNAVLEVCARAGDLESLFTVLATSNSGLRCPDAHTYTIVFNALRYDVSNAGKANLGLIDDDVKREIQKNIQRASSIWADVIENWRSARLIIDDHLVCRIPHGRTKNNESVLELLEQTMQPPRPNPAKLPPVPIPVEPRTHAAPEDAAPINRSCCCQTARAGTDSRRYQNMTAKARRTSPRPKPNPLPRPGPALSSLTNTRKTASAPKYWSYFRDHLNVVPDAENHFCYLRALALGHASAHVAAHIASLPTPLLSPVTFRRGLSACVSDNLNKDAFKHASQIFDVMTTKQRYPDALSMRLYLQVARASTRHFYEPSPSAGGGKPAHSRQLILALDRMWEPFRILSGSLSYPEAATRSPEAERDAKRGDMQEVLATARRMTAAIDRVVNDDEMVPGGSAGERKQMVKLLRTRRAVLQRWIERCLAKLYPDGPPPEEKEKAYEGRERRGGSSVLDEL
ncbi:hypothetical protein NEMBOFW57_000232 [Staphylotrichum longicolle]|uniref:Pentatricopeptide repeat protein n=1 Tax=Staphylotrichum longicolle TaxID=669026 RepID=A0AAD4EZ88_9PEZI|nr:hypothetical protein NEMBOFW57_000232 [Staphylotrichum longicolle]